MKHTKYIPKLILILCIAILTSCASNKTTPPTLSETAKKNILSINIGANPSFLNPILYTDSTSHTVVRMVFNGLFKQDEDLNMEPDLVKDYTISKDGMTYTFNLHTNVTWHDGKPLTAEDIKFTFTSDNVGLCTAINTVARKASKSYLIYSLTYLNISLPMYITYIYIYFNTLIYGKYIGRPYNY